MSKIVGSSASASARSEQSINRATYLKHLLTQASAAADESALGLKALRNQAVALVNERTFPSDKDEEWRFTDLSDMLALPFQRSQKSPNAELDASIEAHLKLLPEAHRAVFVNGHYDPALSASADSNGGVLIVPLSQLIKRTDYPEKIEPLLTERLAQLQGKEEVFTALNTAGFSDVLVVWAQPDQKLEQPICVVRAAQGDMVSHLRTLVIAERHSNITLLESFVNADGDSAQITRCNNHVTELWLDEGAQVNHIRLQDEGSETFHIAKTAVDQSADSCYQCVSIDLGAKLSRHHLEVYQSGAQTDTHMYGLSALRDRQLSDTHSLLNLIHPHSTATQIQKNIVDDRAHSVFNGKVYVSQSAQLTDASQLNRNLMLSSKARVDTKPELDIVADNVKCAHGATVSQMRADEVFYLQSRGISAEQAQRLLLYGFAMEIVEKISIAPLKQSLSERLTQWTH